MTLQSRRIQVDDPLWQEGWVDGLPVVPPTPERVERMLEGTRRRPGEVLGLVPPLGAPASVEKVAINAVAAGCLPEYLPVVIAAVEAALDPAFNLNGIQATTHACAPLIVVNGPLARALNINGGPNCYGQGWRANATIGRALRLVMVNLGGGHPGTTDKATYGHPGKYTFCIAENEAANPWEPLHVERGFGRDESAVSLFACEGPISVSDHVSQQGRGILVTLSDTMATMGVNAMYGGGEYMVGICPDHAAILHRDGWTKGDIREFLFEKARKPLGLLRQGGMYSEEFRRAYWPRWPDLANDSEMIPVLKKPEDLLLIVAGGSGGLSQALPGWGNFGTRAVTRRIDP